MMQNAGPLLPRSSLGSQPAGPGDLVLVWVLLGRGLLRPARGGGVKPKTNSSGRGGPVHRL